MFSSSNVCIGGGDGDGERRKFTRRGCYGGSDRRVSGIGSVGVVTHRRVLSSESAMNRNHRQK